MAALTVDLIGNEELGAFDQFNAPTDSGGNEINPVVARLSTGGVVVAWNVNSTLVTQLFDGNGNRVGSQQVVASSVPEALPTLTGLLDGGYAVGWTAYSASINIRTFNGAGNPTSVVFQADPADTRAQQPSLATLSDGSLVVAWNQTTSSTLIKARVFDVTGTPLTDDILISSGRSTSTGHPIVAALAGGGFAVSWTGEPTATQSQTIYANVYASRGQPVGATSIDAPIQGPNYNFFQSIAAGTDGGFAMSWTRDNFTSRVVQMQSFDAVGHAIGSIQQVNTGTSTAAGASVLTALNGGGYAVAWQQLTVDGGPNYFQQGDVHAQLFDAAMTRIGAEFTVNQVKALGQGLPSITSFGSGDLAVAWQSYASAGNSDVAMRLFYSTTHGTGGDDVLRGSSSVDVLLGGDGDDYLFSTFGDGRGALFGQGGNDVLQVSGIAVPTLTEDMLLDGGEGDDELSYNGLAPTTTSAAYALSRVTLRGGNGDDEIIARDGPLVTVDGGEGSDLVVLSYSGAPGTSFTAGLGAGRDLLVLEAPVRSYLGNHPTVTITDFQAGAGGDAIDLVGHFLGRLADWDLTSNPFAAGYLRLVQSGADAVLRIGQDGTATGTFVDLIRFSGTSVASLTDANLGFDPAGGASAPRTLTGSGERDLILGAAGADQIVAGGGADHVRGGLGNDSIEGGDGNDYLDGQLGDDILFGDAGDDWLNDTTGGSDQMFGGAGNDVLQVTRINSSGSTIPASEMLLDGGADNDVLYYSGRSIDRATLIGGAGNDIFSIQGTGGTILVDAGEGNDRVSAGMSDNQTVTLGAGADVLTVRSASGAGGSITVTDYVPADDRVVLFDYVYGQLTNWDKVTNPFATGHLSLVQSGANTVLRIDRDGPTGSQVVTALITFLNTDASTIVADDLGGLPPSGGAVPGYTYVGTDSAENLNGNLGDDVMQALGGGDTVRGRAGNDEMHGGDGNDLVFGDEGNDRVFGDAGNDLLNGGAGDDLIDSGTGNDTVNGGDGNDGFFFGGDFDALDSVDGGAGTLDQIGLQGVYAALTLGANSTVGVESLVLLPGDDTRFGGGGGVLTGYNLTLVNANVASGAVLAFQANTLRVGENFTLNAAAETDGRILTYAGFGADVITGGQGDDGYYFGQGRFGPGDRIDGQGGFDALAFQGDFAGANAVTFGAGQLVRVELINLLSGGDTRFGGNGASFGYTLITNDGNVAAGAALGVQGNALGANEVLTFDGSAEMDGRFVVFGGAAADSITGGAGADQINGGSGADRITGGGGADLLTGAGGNDTFIFLNYTDFLVTNADTITDFQPGDHIDLSMIDADDNAPGDQAFHLGATADHAGDITVSFDAAANRTTLLLHIDNDGAPDLAIYLTGNHTDLTPADFVI